MFSAKHNNPTYLLEYFKSIQDIVDSINMIIDSSGITLKGMDNSHICLLHCFLSCNEFTEFTLENNLLLGINIKSFCKILHVAEKIDTLIFEYNNSDILDIIFENSSRKTHVYYKLMQLEYDDISIGNIIYPVKVDLCIKRFCKICSEFDIINSDNIKFSVDMSLNHIKIISNGEIGNISTILKFNNKKKFKLIKKNTNGNKKIIELQPEYIVYSMKSSFNVEFSFNKIQDILKISNIVDRIILNIDKENPLKFEFIINNDSYINYYIAPKINIDE